MAGCQMEIDKLVHSFVFQGTNINVLQLQSAGVNDFKIDRSNVTLLLGTAKKTTISNSSIATLLAGPTQVFGRAEELICNNSSIGSISDLGGHVFAPRFTGIDNYTMSGGVIQIANSNFNFSGFGNVFGWAVPGTNLFWTDDAHVTPYGPAFQVTDVSTNGTTTFIQTTLAGGFPAVRSGGNTLHVIVHPAPQYTGINCSGTDIIPAMNAAPARSPWLSYSQITYTGAIGTAAQNSLAMWGNLAQININVTNAFNSTDNFTAGQNWQPWLSNNTQVNYSPTVNAQSAGNRQITLSGVTCVSGSCTGDSGLTAPDATTTFFNNFAASGGAVFSADARGSCPGVNCPSVTITLQTSQGVVNNY
jgi:predicted outer membrane repeat protein